MLQIIEDIVDSEGFILLILGMLPLIILERYADWFFSNIPELGLTGEASLFLIRLVILIVALPLIYMIVNSVIDSRARREYMEKNAEAQAEREKKSSVEHLKTITVKEINISDGHLNITSEKKDKYVIPQKLKCQFQIDGTYRIKWKAEFDYSFESGEWQEHREIISVMSIIN